MGNTGRTVVLGHRPNLAWEIQSSSSEFPMQKGLCGRLTQIFHSSQSPDLPLPHGLAPSETMVWDHGLNPPPSTENPRNKGFSGSGAPIFGFGLEDPAPKG